MRPRQTPAYPLLRGAFIEVEGYLPFDLEHMPWRMRGQHGIQAIETGCSEVALVDVPGNQNCAFALCRWTEKDAGTGSVTVTGFKITAVQFPLVGHDSKEFYIKADGVAGVARPLRKSISANGCR